MSILILSGCPFCGEKPKSSHDKKYAYCINTSCDNCGNLISIDQWKRKVNRSKKRGIIKDRDEV
jgi:hypothetical protein